MIQKRNSSIVFLFNLINLIVHFHQLKAKIDKINLE
jgi:hypothetical protein